MWDFLRDLGETNVGGAEIIKNLGDADMAGFNVKHISGTRMRNVARAFGWWIAKDCCTLAILKVSPTYVEISMLRLIVSIAGSLLTSLCLSHRHKAS